MTDFGNSSRGSPASPLWVVAAVIAVLIVIGLILTSCGGFGGGHALWAAKEERFACPRPAYFTGDQPGFNQQEQEVRHLRRLAFQNDFFAQLELGRRYQAIKATDKNVEDPIESAVWYTMALSNPEGYAPINRAVRQGFFGFRPLSRYDDCRAWERHEAYATLDHLLSHMSSTEQDKVRNRVIYVLSTQGADGFRTLARLYDDLYGPFGEPADNEQALEALGKGEINLHREHPVATLFTRNDVDAYLYNYLAMQTGDVGAYVLLKDFERSSPERASYGAFVEAKANRWIPPYEFYPPETYLPGAVPHSDESHPRGDAYEYALSRMHELPFKHVSDALLYLGVITRPVDSPDNMAQGEIDTFKGMIGEPQGGRFLPIDAVRAIQYASVNGSARAQLVLAVMYAEGVGVPADYARAYYWFSEADRQGSPDAKFAMSTYFALGVQGVADQNKAEAVVYRMDSALSGFKPTVSRIQAVLEQVSRASRHGGGVPAPVGYGPRFDYVGRPDASPNGGAYPAPHLGHPAPDGDGGRPDDEARP
ncbi:MAG TPA: tetratricopeptide repeat protein [Caulobacteraceae bacterium]